MKFGCCISRTDDIPAVKRAGFDYFEFSGTALMAMTEEETDRLAECAKENGLPCSGVNAYCPGLPAIVGDNFSAEKTVTYAEEMCRRVRKLGGSALGIGAPAARQLPEGYPAEKADRQCREFLTLTAGTAERYGLTVLLEALCTQMCPYLNHTADAAAMTASLNLPNLRMVLDFYQMEQMQESLTEAYAAFPYLSHTHVSTIGKALYRGFPQEDELEKYRAIFELLKAAGYDGTLSIEPSRFEPEHAEDSLKMLKTAYAITRKEYK